MKVAVFSAKPYDRDFLGAANARHGLELHFLEPRLTPETASLAAGSGAVCAFVNDDLSAETLHILAALGTRLVALRSAGFNHVDLLAAEALSMSVTRVSAYSPYAVAEHALGLLLTSRGALLDTRAVIAGLKSGVIGHLGLDVYEEEADLFFENLSDRVIQDDVFSRLLTFPNVLITGHQGFFTREALQNIAETTLGNISAFAKGEIRNAVTAAQLA